MLTKKEKLLTHPWIVQKFQSHRRKVQSAGPAIDFRTPSSHPHVIFKLKKTQKEWERLNEIQRENRRLLQRLGQIMSTRRLENFWQYSRPNFLNRERLYTTSKRPKTSPPLCKTERDPSTDDATKPAPLIRGQSARCMVCSGDS
ncbi:hypothetical protein HA402_006890 [Bradysia odoriphaga]|nr:hypothetical protein HA402_006890 [Bradysia odoriphaga]